MKNMCYLRIIYLFTLHYDCVAAPDTNYDNEEPRRLYRVFSNRSSTRDIGLSCPIRPGALEESYSVVWQASNPGSGFTTIDDSEGQYNFSVTVDSSSQSKYQCKVSIQHRSDQVATQDYDGPEIIIEKLGEIVILR